MVIADHGMEKIQGDWIDLERFTNLSDFETEGTFIYPKSEAAAAKAYEQLHGASDKFEVYRRSQFPPELHFNSTDRSGDPIVLATGPYLIRARRLWKARHRHDQRHARLRSLSHEIDARDFLRRRAGHSRPARRYRHSKISTSIR